jgi:4-hydroxy-tetrahydrodipicolinate reductase
MTGPVIIVGRHGKMSRILATCLSEQGQAFKVYSAQRDQSDVSDFKGASGVIDFSLPEATASLLAMAVEAKTPFVCGTTGWASAEERQRIFGEAAKVIPIVWDSNFSLGIEALSQMMEVVSRFKLPEIQIVDIHHSQKRDAPSGTALKLKERGLQHNPQQKITIESIRVGEVPGEHKILISLKDETLELTHRALSRIPFAEGAIRALAWAQNQKPGLYAMKDYLK